MQNEDHNSLNRRFGVSYFETEKKKRVTQSDCHFFQHSFLTFPNATMLHLWPTADPRVAVNNVKPLRVATETQEWILFAPLSNYRIFRIAVKNINVLRS